MEKSWKEKGKKLAQVAAVAGAMALSPGAEAQSPGNWRPVGKQEFENLHISLDKMQKVSANEGNVPTDHTKMGKVYTDRSGASFYWINKSPAEHVDSELTEEEVEAIAQNEEIQNKLEGFFSSFDLESPWFIDPRTNKHYHPYNLHNYVNLPVEIDRLYGSVVIKDRKSGKQVLIEVDIKNDLFILLHRLMTWEKHGIREYLYFSDVIKTQKTREEKIEYLKGLLGDRLEEVIKRLPSYEPQKIIEPEEKPPVVGISKNEENKTRLSPTKETNITINEEDIEKAIDEVFEQEP